MGIVEDWKRLEGSFQVAYNFTRAAYELGAIWDEHRTHDFDWEASPRSGGAVAITDEPVFQPAMFARSAVLGTAAALLFTKAGLMAGLAMEADRRRMTPGDVEGAAGRMIFELGASSSTVQEVLRSEGLSEGVEQ